MSRVAVVDDEDSVRALIGAVLRARGYEVEDYATCGEAVLGLETAPPDLLIVDVRLPDGDGLDLIASQRREGRSFPAIVLSGMVEERDIVRGFEAGAVDYLEKPFAPAQLLARCAVHLRHATATQDTSVVIKKGRAFGRYRIDQQLGRGGCGIVYAVFDEQEGREVALKVLIPSADEESRMRFLRETAALQAIDHPRIVRVHEFGAAEGRLYYTMDLIEGPSLFTRIDEGGTLRETAARRLLGELAEALVVIEKAGVLHRDIKPSNIVLRGGDPADPVLIDFGLAKRRTDRALTADDIIVGTPGYIPPEVVAGAPPDCRSDLFELGMTIRFALTGEEVFPELSGNDLLLAIAKGPIPLDGVRVTPGFRQIVERLLVTNPARRFASASELLQALSALDAAGV